MTAATADPRACSVARTLDIVGEKWALLAVREVFLGNRRFDEMVRRTGAPRDTLAARLRTLVGAGILERRQYCEHPARYEYRLTDAGRDLYPVITTLMRWGDKYLAGDAGPPLVLRHHCGHPVVATVICAACGEPLEAQHTVPLASGKPAALPAEAAVGHEPDHRHGREQGVGDPRADERQPDRGRVDDQGDTALEVPAEGQGHR
jgi:DNA-binding HxlR family transcriptional regulator